MKKILTILILFSFTAQAKYKVASVYDGDTVKLYDKKLEEPFNHISLRMLGIDTPELKRYKCSLEGIRGLSAKTRLMNLLENNKYYIEYVKWDKYGGRVLGHIHIGTTTAAKILIKEGYGIRYYGGKKTHDWCEE